MGVDELLLDRIRYAEDAQPTIRANSHAISIVGGELAVPHPALVA